MKHFDLKLHYACNNNCIHCVIADQRRKAVDTKGKDWLSTAQAMYAIKWGRQSDFDMITFTGGEPTIRKDLPQLVRLAKQLNYNVIAIQTNARVLSIQKLAQALSGYGVRFVIALHGSKPEVHDAVTRAPGSFKQTVEGIKNLISLGEMVTIKTVISKVNMEDLPEIARLGISLGVKRFNFTFPHALGNAMKMFDQVVPRYSELKPYLFQAFRVLEKQKDISIGTETIPYCILGESRMHYAIEFTALNSVKSVSYQLDEGLRNWTKDRWNEEKGKPESCNLCLYKDRCEGVWVEYLERFGGEDLRPLTDICDGVW